MRSILLPFLFNLYAKPVGKTVQRSGVIYHQLCWWDKALPFFLIWRRPCNLSPFPAAVEDWMQVSQLKVHLEKTEAMVLGKLLALGVLEHLSLMEFNLTLPFRFTTLRWSWILHWMWIFRWWQWLQTGFTNSIWWEDHDPLFQIQIWLPSLMPL